MKHNNIRQTPPKVSILLAVHNGENSLHNALKCLMEQTLKDIEIICVDDASTDRSVEIIRQYQEQDKRIQLVAFGTNRGTVCARYAGIKAATGKYLLFMDQDDCYLPEACGELYTLIEEKQVEILHYSTQVIPIPPTTEIAAVNQEKFLEPYPGYLYGEEVFRACFFPDEEDAKIWNKYTWSLWNKMCLSQMCKEAMKQCPQDYVINGDDVYVYMRIAFFAKSYYGDAGGKKYYSYRYGTGLMGHYKLDMKKFYTICCRMKGYQNEEMFFRERGLEEQYREALALDFCRSLNGIVTRWYQRLESSDYARGFDMMLKHLHYLDIIKGFHRHLNIHPEKLMEAVRWAGGILPDRDRIENIGLYIGRIQKKLNSSQRKWKQQLTNIGYRVYLYAEEGNLWEEAEEDVTYLKRETIGKCYEYPIEARMEKLNQDLQEQNIDLYVVTGQKGNLWVYDWLCVVCNHLFYTDEQMWNGGWNSFVRNRNFCSNLEKQILKAEVMVHRNY